MNLYFHVAFIAYIWKDISGLSECRVLVLKREVASVDAVIVVCKYAVLYDVLCFILHSLLGNIRDTFFQKSNHHLAYLVGK